MKLSKLSMAVSAGALTAAALVLAPAATSVPLAPQAGVDVPKPQVDPTLKGLLRPSRPDQAESSEAEGTRSPGSTLVPARPGIPAGVKRSQEADRHELEEQYRLRLSQSDLDAREQAFDEITRQASAQPAARAALESITGDLGDPDLAFTARLALREVSREVQASARGLFSPGARGFSADPFEAMQQRMEDMLQRDPFVQDLFADDPFFSRGGNRLFRRRPGVFRSGGATAVDPLEAMRERTEAIRKQFEELQSSNPPVPGSRTSPFSSSSSMSVETTRNGVRVEISENDGSGPKTRVYEAPSMDALLEANPELKGRLR